MGTQIFDTMEKEYIIATTTTPSRESADQIALDLVQKRLAACVQIVEPLTSYYRWEGSIQKKSEHLIIIKTLKKHIPAISRSLSKMHPYDVPELIAMQVVSGSTDYLSWLIESVRP